MEAARAVGASGALEGGCSVAVIGRALLGVLQDVVGVVDFLELPFGVLVVLIAVWVMLHSGSRGIGNAIADYFIQLARKITQP